MKYAYSFRIVLSKRIIQKILLQWKQSSITDKALRIRLQEAGGMAGIW